MGIERLVVIGASSGGIEAVSALVRALPPDFGAALCVVIHTAPQSPGVLPRILDVAGPLQALHPRDGQRMEPGVIYVAPPDHHLLVEPGVLRLSRGPRENRFRPAIDPLFRSAAQVYGPRAIGVVLSGNLDDGTAGLGTIKQLGGFAIVQDPEDALYPSMPASAMTHVAADLCLPADEIGGALVRLLELSVHATAGEVARALEVEVMIAKGEDPIEVGIEELGTPSPYSCPDCQGVLREVSDGGRVRYRCHTGHAYSTLSLLAASDEGVEEALYKAIRALEEANMFLRHAARGEADPTLTSRLETHAARALADTGVLREMVTSRQRLTLHPSRDDA